MLKDLLPRRSLPVVHDRWLVVAYVLLVVGVAVFLTWEALQAPPTVSRSPIRWAPVGWTPSVTMCAVWGIGLLMLTAVPFYPSIGLFVYVGLIYGTARYRPELEYAYLHHFHEWILGLSLAGWLVSRRSRSSIEGETGIHDRLSPTARQAGGERAPGGGCAYHGSVWTEPTTRVLIALLVWIAASTTVAVFSGDYRSPDPTHRPLRYACCGIAFLLAATSVAAKRDLAALAACLVVALVVRDRVWPDMTYLDGDISVLAAIALPLALAAAFSCKHSISVLVCLSGIAAMGWLLYSTHNRAAAVAFVVILFTLWLGSRRKILILSLAIPLLVAAGMWFQTTDYWARFADKIYRNGAFIGSAQSRLEIWEMGFRLYREQPYFGSGPGTFASRLNAADQQLGTYVAHNNYLELLVEMGIPGVILYLLFFGLVGRLAWRIRRRCRYDRSAGIAVALGAAVAAYLTAGLFVSRQDLPLAYMIAGCIVAWERSTRMECSEIRA